MTLKQLYEERGKLLSQMKDLGKQIEEADDPVVAKEKQEQFKKWDEEREAVIGRIAIVEKAQKLEAETAKVINTPEKQDVEEKKKEAFVDFCRNGYEGLTPEKKATMSSMEYRLSPQEAAQERTTAQSTTAGKGGYTIPTLVMNDIMTAQLYFGGMLDDKYTNWIRTPHGEPITVPTNDDTGNSGYLLTEATDAETSATDTDIATKTLNAYKYTSGLVRVSYELLQDTAYSNFTGWFVDLLMTRLFRGINTAFTTGTGSSQPQGIDGAATKGEDGAARSITRTDILNLLHSVDRAYRFAPSSAFMLNDDTLLAIKALTIGSADDRPLWQPSIREGEPDKLEGRPYLVNNDVSDIFPTYKPVFFGDWKKFGIRQAGGLRVKRFDELFGATDQVAFVVLGRYDSELLAGDAPIKFIRCGVT